MNSPWQTKTRKPISAERDLIEAKGQLLLPKIACGRSDSTPIPQEIEKKGTKRKSSAPESRKKKPRLRGRRSESELKAVRGEESTEARETGKSRAGQQQKVEEIRRGGVWGRRGFQE